MAKEENILESKHEEEFIKDKTTLYETSLQKEDAVILPDATVNQSAEKEGDSTKKKNKRIILFHIDF